jgi:hypothetical protein
MVSSKRWWRTARTLGVDKAKEEMKKELRRWSRSRKTKDRLLYMAAHTTYYGIIRQAKKRTWEDFMVTLKGKEVWQVMRYTKSRSAQTTPHLLNPENQPCITFPDKVSEFGTALYPPPTLARLQFPRVLALRNNVYGFRWMSRALRTHSVLHMYRRWGGVCTCIFALKGPGV